MEQVRDAVVLRLIERINEHYRTNISNRFIRPVLLQLSLDKPTWDLIESLTEKFDQFRYQGFHLDELYRQIAAVTRFIVATRHEIAPSIKHRLAGGGLSGADKVLRDMAGNNFTSNLQLFADLVLELYNRVVEIDTAASAGKTPLYQQAPQFQGLGDMLLHG